MIRTFRIASAFFIVFLLSGQPVWSATYAVDPDHTSVSFKIRHIFTQVQGFFREFEGTFVYDPDRPESWKAKGSIQAASIDTNVEKRDDHLRSADFFEVETYPLIEFETTNVLEHSAQHAKIEGTLKMHGVEKPVILDVDFLGTAVDPWGNEVAAMTATTTINRKDFGLGWNKVLETGQVLVGEEVQITLEIEGVVQEE